MSENEKLNSWEKELSSILIINLKKQERKNLEVVIKSTIQEYRKNVEVQKWVCISNSSKM